MHQQLTRIIASLLGANAPRRFREANELPIDQVKIASPFDERMRYNVYSALVILSRHQHRHLEQAENVWRK